jgi:CheY-like chemotaxis protein
MDYRASVLVVDDDEAIRDVIAEVLRDEGYRVTCAENGEQALAELRSPARPDLMLLDLMMPVLSGWEVLEVIAADERLGGVAVVVVSAMAGPTGYEHLLKPIDLDRLLDTVKRGIGGVLPTRKQSEDTA